MPNRSNRGNCRQEGCKAPILWVKHHRTGKAASLDPTPSPGGNIAIDEETGTYSIVPEEERPGRMLYTNHWATCAQPPQKRRTPHAD